MDIRYQQKYKNVFTKGYTPNWYEEIFLMKKVKNTLPWTCVISDQRGEEILGTFYDKELRKTNEKVFRVKTVTKRKDDRLYIKRKEYDNSFNCWIIIKDIA